MISRTLQRLADIWQKLSERERRLALITAVVVALMLAVTSYQRAVTRLRELDTTIDRLEDELVSHAHQIAHRELVESRYATMAAQHSSAWTEAEIHDRLRQEIYRLARRMPPPLDETGIPVNMPNEHGNLVEIPALGQGNLVEGGQGYREYRINLRIPPAPLENIIYFLERLQESPQSLRIDLLELNRAHDGAQVTANLDISRIVADGAPSAVAPTEAVAEGMGRIPLQASAWQSARAQVLNADAGAARGAIEIRATNNAAEAWTLRNLPSGAVYEMIIDIACSADVVLGVGIDGKEQLFEGAERVTGDGRGYRYHVQFTLPRDGATVRVRCPWIQLPDGGAEAHVSNLLLRKITEV